MIIGISGARQSGKSTLGALLAERYQLRHTSFAEPMRKFVADVLGITVEDLELIKEDPIPWLDGKTPRFMLRTIGTEWGRMSVHNEIWIRSALQRGGENCVFSDVRFLNEARIIRDAGGYVVRVHRDLQLPNSEHISDTPLPAELVDLEVNNNGGPEEMLMKVSRQLFPLPQENPAVDQDVAAYSAPGCPASAQAGD